MRKLLSVLLAAIMLFSCVGALAETASGTFDLYVYGYEWGPAIPYIVVEFDKPIDASSVEPADFSVVAHANGFMMATDVTSEGDIPHEVTGAYICDKDGNAIEGESSNFVRIDLTVHPDGIANKTYVMGSFLDGTIIRAGGVNVWYDGFTEAITLTEGATLTSGGLDIEAIEISKEFDTVKPEMAKWVFDQKYTAADGNEFNYAEYKPAEDDVQNALIIWLHGAGECGTDSSIDLLCNESDDIAEEKIQSYFGGAYVIAPQCLTMWMDDDDENGDGDWYTSSGKSIYTAALQEFIESYVAGNADVDPNRVIIGGCSNGGYMTVNMLINYPGYYATAYPICEAYQTEWITDEQIENLKKENIWFVHCLADDTVNPQTTTVALMEKLGELPNVKATYYDSVVNTSGEYKTAEGEQYTYMTHWVWIYALNDEVVDGETSLWAWLAAQTK